MSSCNDPCGDAINIVVSTNSAGPIGPPGPPSKVLEWTFYPSVGDTIIAGDDASANPLAYTPDSVQVFLNGVMLSKRDDYTTDNDGTSIVLNEAIVNVNDVVVVVSQVPPEDGYDPTNDFDRLDGKIEDNTLAIEGLDVRVTANEEAIEGLTGLAGGFTTRDVKVSGVNTSRAVDDDVQLENQQDINLHLDSSIGTIEDRLDAVEGGQPDLSSDIEDLRTDVDDNTQGIADNAQSLSGLVDVVQDNIDDISSLQSEVDALPPAYDDKEIKEDLNDISLQVGENTLNIADNTQRLDALAAPIDLDPLNDAISLNAMGISSNAADITKLQATDAKQAGQIGSLEGDVTQLRDDVDAIDITDVAYHNVDNQFTVSQTIQDGVTLRGKTAAFKADTGSMFTFDCNNAFNTVVSIRKSGGNEAISLAANGNIKGVVTDDSDPTSAVSVGWLEDNGISGGDHDHDSKYATKIQLKDEELARQLADQELQKNIDALEAFDETKLTNRIAQEEAARAAGDASLDGKIKTEAKYRADNDDALQEQIDALQIPAVDPSLYATVVAMHAGDAETLAAANKYTNEAIADIDFPEGVDLDGYATQEWTTEQIEAIEFPAGTVVSDTAPVDPEEGATWYDTVRLELFVFAEDAWLPCSPLGARFDAAEATQAALISQVDDALEKQLALTKTVNDRSRTQDGLVVTTQLLSDKVDALEGSTLDAKYKADARENPQIGSFVLQDADGNKVLKFADAKKIELSKTDFTNKAVGLSKVMNGDIIRLVLSPTHYANYTIASVDPKEQTFVFGLTFGSAGSEEVVFDGAVYNFTHATPFDPEAFATIDYVDAQDVKRISLSGENTIDTSWRVKSGNKTIMSGAEEGKIKIYHLAEPTDGDHAATKTYADKMLPRSGTSDLIGDWRVRQENAENNYSTLIHGDNGQLGLYNLKDPGDSHHAVPRSYVDDANVANAKKNDSNTFKEVNTFQKTSYFQNGIVHANGNNDTLTEVRGENEETKEFWHKLRGTCKASWIAYPGQENSGYKRCMTMEWDQESGKPQVFIDYVMDPVNGKHCANKQYVDQKVAEAGGGSFANTGPTTPDLSAGELFFNTTDKVLYIGE